MVGTTMTCTKEAACGAVSNVQEDDEGEENDSVKASTSKCAEG